MKDNDIFISYSHQDISFAEELDKQLTSKGWNVWRDNDIPRGALWKKNLNKHLESSSLVIVIVSPASMRSQYVTYEWCRAKFELDKELLPVYLGMCTHDDGYFQHFESEVQLPPLLDLDNVHGEIEKLCNGVNEVLTPLRSIQTFGKTLNDSSASAEAKINAIDSLAQFDTLRSTVTDCFIVAIKHQIQYGYGPVQIRLAKVLETHGNSRCIPDLVKLFVIASSGNDYYGKAVGESIVTTLAALYNRENFHF